MADRPILLHNDFLMKNLNRYIFEDRRKAEENNELTVMVPYGKYESLIECPEPLLFLQEFNELGNNKERCKRLFEQKLKGFRRIKIPKAFNLWWNTSCDQINLRLGISKDTTQPTAIALGDTTVHGLIAGQTGSGKSVLLHNLIFNLMAEYPPWEIDLYLADFKRVEFSKYMDEDHPAPHVAACAATGEIRYVLSLIEHLVDCMNAREDFFKRMGFEKISKFRAAYPQVVLPRILLIVDEFQQMFLDASARESETIHRLLTAIVKKGRATGVHIVFASQEMSQTLSRSALSNFRMRIALNCDPNVSMDVLGNRAAADCEKGYVIANCADYTIETNKKYQVPYVETEVREEERRNGAVPYFDQYLMSMSRMAASMGYKKNSKFYQEDYQEPIERLTEILEKIRPYKEKVRLKYFDALTLGRYVTYCPLKYDIQTLFIERGRNRNIMAVSSNLEDICYVQKLLALNFSCGDARSRGSVFRHEIYSFMAAAEGVYKLENELRELQGGDEYISVCRNPEEFNKLQRRFTRMRFLLPLFEQCEAPLQFALLNYTRNIEEEVRRRPDLRKERENCLSIISERLKDVTFENAEESLTAIMREEPHTVLEKIAENTLDFCRFKRDRESFLPPTVIWISGIDILERLPDWFLWMMKNGMDYNLLFVVMAGSDFDSMTQVAKYCDYLILGGANRRIYDRLMVNFTSRQPDSIALDTVIKSSGEERSFKKYRCSFGKHESARIPFEELLD